jgi:hypothetical protein
MKSTLKYLLVLFIFFISMSQFSQVGIGTLTPDDSAVLDLVSADKGFLMPRLSAAEISSLTLPAKGLIVFNTTTNDSEINIGTPSVPLWIGIKRPVDPMMYAVNGVNDFIASESVALQASDLTLTPTSGTFLATFNGHMSNATFTTTSFDSAIGEADLISLYNQLSNITSTGTHPIIFGGDEIITPGVYETGAALTLNGSFTLAGGTAEENPVFIFRGPGAFTTAVGITISLTGNAKPENIFWMSDVAMSTAANVTMKGTMMGAAAGGAGAMSTGADTDLEGRIFTKLGAVTLGANTKIVIPTGASPVDLGSLSTFALWSNNGGVSDVATADTTGDAGTVAGVLSMTYTESATGAGHHGEAYFPNTEGGEVTNISTTTYSIYVDGTEVLDSRRTIEKQSTLISIQTMVTVASDALPVELRWRVNKGTATLSNRFFSLIRSEH